MNSIFFSRDIKRFPFLIHVCVWTCYTCYIFLTNYVANPALRLIDTVTFLIPYYITFYVVLFLLNLYKNKNLVWSVGSFFIAFIAMALFGYGFIYGLLPLMGIKLYSQDGFRHFIQAAILGYVQFFTYAMLYFYFDKTIRKERELRMLQEKNDAIERQKMQRELENALLKQQELKSVQEKLQLEYAFLRSQINPHFLYNTLNVLYAQALKISPSLADNISKLSDIMRYSMESVEYNIAVVSVQKELENLQTLIEINHLRFANAQAIEYNVEGQVGGQLIPPLSMVTVVENAFKYGDLKDPSNPLQIKVALRPGRLYFFCRNKKRKNNLELSSHSIGLKNLTNRLEATFKDRYNMKTFNEKDFYTFELTIHNI